MSNAFCGGVASSHEEMCGALSAGIMLIGERYGRTSSAEDDRASLKAAAAYRQRFIERFGSTTCEDLRGRESNCAWLVEDASHILIDVMAEDWAAEVDNAEE